MSDNDELGRLRDILRENYGAKDEHEYARMVLNLPLNSEETCESEVPPNDGNQLEAEVGQRYRYDIEERERIREENNAESRERAIADYEEHGEVFERDRAGNIDWHNYYGVNRRDFA